MGCQHRRQVLAPGPARDWNVVRSRAVDVRISTLVFPQVVQGLLQPACSLPATCCDSQRIRYLLCVSVLRTQRRTACLQAHCHQYVRLGAGAAAWSARLRACLAGRIFASRLRAGLAAQLRPRRAGWNGITEAACNARGCCFAPLPSTVGSLGAPLSLPACFLPNNGASAYNLVGGFSPSGAAACLSGAHAEMLLRGSFSCACTSPCVRPAASADLPSPVRREWPRG